MGSILDELRAALHAIWMRRWIALAVAWALCLAGWLVVSQMGNRYESTARISVEVRDILPNQNGVAAGRQNTIDRVRQTLTSSVNLEKVVRGTGLARTVATDRDVAARIAGLQKSIKLIAQQDNLFQISAEASDPKTAREIVQKLIDIFVEDNLESDRDTTSQSLRFLDQSIDSRQKQLQEAEAKKADFENKYLGSLPGTGSLNDRISAARTQLAQVESDLAAAQSSLAAVNAQMAGTPASVAGAGGGGASAGPARARLATIQGQIAEARGRGFTDNHPDMIALKSQLAQAQAAAKNEPVYSGGSGATANPVYIGLKSMQTDKAAQVAALVQRKTQLQGDLAALESKLEGAPGVAAEQAAIDRDYRVLKDQYDKLLADREQMKLRSQIVNETDAVKFTVVDPPTQPRAPTAPNRPLLLTAVLILGLGAGLAAAFALGKLQATFATAKGLEKASGMPVIGSIGEFVSAAERVARRKRLTLFAGGTVALGIAYFGLVSLEFVQRGMAA